MNKITVVKPQPHDEDGNFPGFLVALRKKFKEAGNGPLFKVWTGENLFEIFLKKIWYKKSNADKHVCLGTQVWFICLW